MVEINVGGSLVLECQTLERICWVLGSHHLDIPFIEPT
jgi:hypothetical protein